VHEFWSDFCSAVCWHSWPSDSYHKPCTCCQLQSGSRVLQAMSAIDIMVGYQLCARSNAVRVEQVLRRIGSNVHGTHIIELVSWRHKRLVQRVWLTDKSFDSRRIVGLFSQCSKGSQ
jgi:hypothetical protein